MAWLASLGLLGLYLFYVVAANVALRSGLVGWAASNERRTLTFASAWTLWPTIVHVRDFDFRMNGRTFQVAVAADEATLDISLWTLVKKQFSAKDITVEGLTVQYSKKLEPGPQAQARIEDFPAIDGLPPPLRDPLPPRRKRPWTVDLQGLDASATQVWVNEYRVDGTIDFTGSYWHRIGQELALDSVAIELQDLSIHVGDEPLMADLNGLLSLQLPRVAIEEMLPAFSFAVDARGHIVELSALPMRSKFRVGGGAGTLALKVEAAAGEWLPGGRARYETSGLALRHGDYAFTTEARVDALVPGEDAGRPRVTLHLKDGDARHGKKSAAQFAGIIAKATGKDRSLAEPSLSNGRVEIQNLILPDLAELDPLLRSDGMSLRGGALKLDFEADLNAAKVIEAKGKVRLADAALDTEAVGVRASGTVVVEGSHAITKQRLNIRELIFNLPELAVRSKRGKNNPISLAGSIRPLTWQEDEGLQMSLRSEIGSLRPFFLHGSRLKKWIPDDLGVMDEDVVDIDVDVTRSPAGAVEVRLNEANINAPAEGALKITGLFRKVGDRHRGVFLTTKPIKLGVVITADDRKTKLRADREWLEQMFPWVAGVDALAAADARKSP